MKQVGKYYTKKAQGKILFLPEDYLRKNRFTTYLQKHRGKDILICWYIGYSTRRLFAMYWDRIANETNLIAYNIKKNDMLEYDLTLQVVHANDQPKSNYASWEDVQDNLRISPEVFCTEYMAFYLGIEIYPPRGNFGKVIHFPEKETAKTHDQNLRQKS